MASVLITGGSGMIGTRLTEILLQRGFRVAHLGRSPEGGPVSSFVWDVEKGTLDPRALDGVDAIIHLAGAGVADKRWTEKRKRLILESRTKSSALLYQALSTIPNTVKIVVSASAIGIYGGTLDDALLNEETPPGSDFLSTVVVNWEKEVDRISSLGLRVVRLRIGIVLSNKGGALMEMVGPIKWFVGSPLGTGRQPVSWIHWDDVCEMFIKAITDESMRGVYNATGPYAVTNKELTRAIAKTIHRPIIMPPVPEFVLRLILGEVTDVVVTGANVSSAKIQKTGFTFRYPDLGVALENLLKG